MQVRTFEFIGSEDRILRDFCRDPYIVIRSEKIFFDSKDCAFNVVIYYEVSSEPLDARTCVSIFSSSSKDIQEMNAIMSDERNFIASKSEFCAKGGGPVFFAITYCYKVDKSQIREIELKDDYDEGGVLF